MTVEIRIAQNNDAEEWNSIISQSPHGTLFHQWEWLKITEKHTETRLFPLIGMKNGVPIGVIPLFFQKKGPIRMVFSPPPHAALFYLGPVLAGCDLLRQEKTENLYSEFQNGIENFINNDLNAQYISISLTPAFQDTRQFKWSGYRIHPYFDYAVDLSKGVDFLHSSLDRKQRSAIKKAKEREMIFEIGEEKEYEKILDLMDNRYAEQGKIITASRSYFTDLYKIYKNNIMLSVIKVENDVVTGSIHLKYRDTVYNWQGNPKPKNPLNPSPNDLLIWESIRYSCENGFKYYTTMSAAGNKRLHSYYVCKCNPALVIRYTATKKSLLAGFFEKSYTHLIKPMRARIRYLRPD
jgi:hypothetical protein